MSVSGVSQLKKLSELPQGVEAVVVKMKLEQGEADRLSDLGMRHGSTVRILCGGENQTILVAVGDVSALTTPRQKRFTFTKEESCC